MGGSSSPPTTPRRRFPVVFTTDTTTTIQVQDGIPVVVNGVNLITKLGQLEAKINEIIDALWVVQAALHQPQSVDKL